MSESDPGETTSGAHDCFEFGIELDGRGGSRPVDADAPGDAPRWLHIDYSGDDARSWLAARGLQPAVIETLVRSESRPRSLPTEGGLLVVLRGINMNPGADPEDMVSLRMWVEPGRVITARQRRLFACQELFEACEAGHGPRDIPQLVVELVERIADRIAEFVDDIEERVLAYEATVETEATRQLMRELSGFRRETAIVRRYVAPLREAVDALSRHAEERFGGQLSYVLRDQADRIARSVEDLELVRERLHVVQEEIQNRITQEQNDRLYLFSVVAAIFLPITFISGVFGMNTAGLPGLEEPKAFWLVALGMLGITIGVVSYLRHRKWF